MKRVAFLTAITFCMSLTSFFMSGESKAALRTCTGKEIALVNSYKAQQQIQRFYPDSSSDSIISGLGLKIDNIYNSCDTASFKYGSPGAKAPACTSSDIDWLTNIRTAYSQQVNLEAQNSNDIDTSRKAYDRYISSGQTQMAQNTSLAISKLQKEIQHHYLMQVYYKNAFAAISSSCKNSSVTLPPRALDQNQSNSSQTGANSPLSSFPERYMGYRSGDISPVSITSQSCGPNAPHKVSIDTLDSTNKWQRTELDSSDKYDLSGKYAIQVKSIPVDSFRTNIGNGSWRGIKWPYQTQNAFTVERCDFANRGSHANKNYDLSVFGTAKGTWTRQAVDNLDPFTYESLGFNYQVDATTIENFDDLKWSCAVKKPVTTSVKKNGKVVKVTTPAVSDFKVNVSSDGEALSIWECDDLKQGKFLKVQSISLANAWDTTEKTGKGETLWEVAKLDPKYPNWTWACPAGTGSKTCFQVSSLK